MIAGARSQVNALLDDVQSGRPARAPISTASPSPSGHAASPLSPSFAHALFSASTVGVIMGLHGQQAGLQATNLPFHALMQPPLSPSSKPRSPRSPISPQRKSLTQVTSTLRKVGRLTATLATFCSLDAKPVIILDLQRSLVSLPQFYFPRPVPQGEEAQKAEFIRRVDECFSTHPGGMPQKTFVDMANEVGRDRI